jgi:hypothetical protein|tara:strand:+ start:4161 stop:4946 length:786 start_codon:yes stop_codon:yes gene_type:complete
MTGNTPAAFPFFYIDPKKFPKLIRRFAGEHLTDSEIEQMDPIGSSPVFIHKKDLATIAPIWRDVTLKIKQDKEADKEWGWVLEMYGYTIAAKIAGVRHDLVRVAFTKSKHCLPPLFDVHSLKGSALHTHTCTVEARLRVTVCSYTLRSTPILETEETDPFLSHSQRPQLQAQPPWDKSIGEFFILHFTYGNDYDLNGKFTPGKIGQWRFDKRTWMSSIPPKNLPLPPAGCDNELVKRLVEMVNEASANLPNWENPLGVGRG